MGLTQRRNVLRVRDGRVVAAELVDRCLVMAKVGALGVDISTTVRALVWSNRVGLSVGGGRKLLAFGKIRTVVASVVTPRRVRRLLSFLRGSSNGDRSGVLCGVSRVVCNVLGTVKLRLDGRATAVLKVVHLLLQFLVGLLQTTVFSFKFHNFFVVIRLGNCLSS